MTETASSPLACNPLPPGQRKLGSVGIPVDLDVAIMDEGGALLGRGQTGQVVVKGTADEKEQLIKDITRTINDTTSELTVMALAKP